VTVGLRIRDGAGNITLDVTDRITRQLGTVATGTTNGRFDDARVAGGNAWFHAMSEAYFDSSSVPPRIVLDANGFSWTYQLASGQTARPMQVIYGLY
jgi:hypothetical protein